MRSDYENLGVDVEVVKVKGRTSSVRFKKGKAVIRLSRYLTLGAREKALDRFLEWIENRVKNMRGDFVNDTDYVHNGVVVTHNKVYRIEVNIDSSRKRSSFKIVDDCVVLNFAGNDFDEVKVEKVVKKLIMKDQLPYLKEVIEELNALYFQADFGKVMFKDVESKYGSCSSKKDIVIAYKLLLVPKEVFRYVCVHELAHLIEFNHSAKFWNLVKEAMPNYQEAEEWLKYNGWKF